MARPGFLSYKNSTRPGLRLQFAEISLQQFLQFARPRHNNGVAFDPQKLLVTKFASVRDNVSLVVPISAASTRLVRLSLISTGAVLPMLRNRNGRHLFPQRAMRV